MVNYATPLQHEKLLNQKEKKNTEMKCFTFFFIANYNMFPEPTIQLELLSYLNNKKKLLLRKKKKVI